VLRRCRTRSGDRRSGTRRDLPARLGASLVLAIKPGASRILMDLPRDFDRSVFGVRRRRRSYLLVGGHAVSAHGRPRSTKDVDLLARPRARYIDCACLALSSSASPRDARPCAIPDRRISCGSAAHRQHRSTSILPGVDLNTAWPRRVTIDLKAFVYKLTVGEHRSPRRAIPQSNVAPTKRAATRNASEAQPKDDKGNR